MTSNKNNHKNYNIWSSFYDDYPNPTVAIDELYFTPYYSHLEKLNILEIGCGTGRHTKRLIDSYNIVTGIDISEGMLKKAREKIENKNLTLINGDFIDEPIPNTPFDVIIMSLVLEHISDLNLFFTKARSVLKKGGLFYFSEIHPLRAEKGSLAHFKKDNGVEIYLSSISHDEEGVRSASESLFLVEDCKTVKGDEKLTSLNPKWEKYLGVPMIQVWSMRAL